MSNELRSDPQGSREAPPANRLGTFEQRVDQMLGAPLPTLAELGGPIDITPEGDEPATLLIDDKPVAASVATEAPQRPQGFMSRMCSEREHAHCGGQVKFANADNADDCYPCSCSCHQADSEAPQRQETTDDELGSRGGKGVGC